LTAAPQLELTALGDFDRSNDSIAILASDAALRNVHLPQGTRAAEIETLGGDAFWGSGTLDPHNQLAILLWPRDRSCVLARIDADLAAEPDAWSLGASERLQTLLVTGPGQSRGVAVSVDLASGVATLLDAASKPREARTHASLSELGDALVLAGGFDPSGRVLDSAELFEPALGGFVESKALSLPRARHAALALPAGRTLLIGGESEGGAPLGSVEVLARDATRFSRVFELLAMPRVAPRAVLLEADRILVGGGYTPAPDGSRQPIAEVEILSTDFTDATAAPIPLEPAALERAFVALGAGAALAVGGCDIGASTPDCLPCAGGCVSRAVWWLDPRGVAHELEPLPLALSVADPELVSGAGGRPWLLAGGRFGHFDPWAARFELVDLGPAVSKGARVLGAPATIRAGAFAWLEASASGVELAGFYHSQRGPWTQDVAPLLVGSAAGMVPERPPIAGDAGPERLSYDIASGLALEGAGAVVEIADTTYADFSLELGLSEGPPPLVELLEASAPRNGASFGGIECPWPDLEQAEPSTGTARLRVERSLDQVRLELLDDTGPREPRPEPCSGGLPERVTVRLVGTRAGTTRLTSVEIRRTVER
jgi:hypothetical protein